MEEALIAAVQKRPAFFDKSQDNYSNRNYGNKQWVDIAKEVGVEEQVARKKWTRLRDYFQRSHRQLITFKSGSAASKTKKWYLHDQMSFLAPFLADRPTSSDISDLSDASSDYDITPLISPSQASVASAATADIETDLFGSQLQHEPCSQPPETQNKQPQSQQPRLSRKRNFPQTQKSPGPNLDIHVIKAIQDLGSGISQKKPTDVDEDEHYCLSLVSKMKRLDPISKMQCQMDIHAVLLKYLTRTEPHTTEEHRNETTYDYQSRAPPQNISRMPAHTDSYYTSTSSQHYGYLGKATYQNVNILTIFSRVPFYKFL